MMKEHRKRRGFGNSGLFSVPESVGLALLSPRMTLNVLREKLSPQRRAPYPYQFVLLATDRCNLVPDVRGRRRA